MPPRTCSAWTNEFTQLTLGPYPLSVGLLRTFRFGHDKIAALHNVCFWHKTDITTRSTNVRFWGSSGHRTNLRECLLLTHCGHYDCGFPNQSFRMGWCCTGLNSVILLNLITFALQ